jgi:hypothetical protein
MCCGGEGAARAGRGVRGDEAAHTEQRGAISKTYLGSVVFELVHSRERAGLNHERSPQLQKAISGFGMDTITLAGPLEAKLQP